MTLARYANAVLSACQGLLEDERTTAEDVGPICEVLQQVRWALCAL